MESNLTVKPSKLKMQEQIKMVMSLSRLLPYTLEDYQHYMEMQGHNPDFKTWHLETRHLKLGCPVNQNMVVENLVIN